MTSVKDPRRRIRPEGPRALRRDTTLFEHTALLNPFRYGLFAFALWSHKVMRWLAPCFLVITLLAPLALLPSFLSTAALVCRVVFYLGALAALAEFSSVHLTFAGKVALYLLDRQCGSPRCLVPLWHRRAPGAVDAFPSMTTACHTCESRSGP